MGSKKGASEGGLATRLGEILSETSTEADWELVTAFVAASHSATGPVLGFNDHVVLTNDAARRWLEPADQGLLQDLARQSRAANAATSTMLTLSRGPVRLHTRMVTPPREAACAGVLVRAEFLPDNATDTAWRSGLPAALPGLVGSAPSWRRCCCDLEVSYRRGEWVALTGEPGVGKHAVATAVHHRHHPGVWAQTVEVTRSGVDNWLAALSERLHTDPPATLILRHADQLSPTSAASLTTLLAAVAEQPSRPWVVATLAPPAVVGPEMSRLLELFGCSIDVPPLRHRLDDLPELVAHRLAVLDRTGRLRCSASTLNVLQRASWPGNITALNDLLTHLARTHPHASTIEPSDLPAEYRAVSRRALPPLAAREREAILHALCTTGGNKAQAAKHLGISRATIYRKIHQYRITPQDTTG